MYQEFCSMTNPQSKSQTKDILFEARENVINPKCDPEDVEKSLENAVEALEPYDIDTTFIKKKLNEHKELTGENGFHTHSRNQCYNKIDQIIEELQMIETSGSVDDKDEKNTVENNIIIDSTNVQIESDNSTCEIN